RAEAMAAEELKERYESILTWYNVQSKAQFVRKRLLLLADQKKVYQNQLTNSNDFEIKDLLKAETEIQQLERELVQLQTMQEDLAERLLLDVTPEGSAELSIENWISFSTMSFVLENISQLPNHNPLLAIQQTEVDLESLNLDLELAEGKQILDFVQLKYSGRESQTVPQEFSLGIGVRIPTKATSRQKVNEAQLDLFDEQYKQRQLEAKIAERLRDYYQSYQQLETEYQMLIKQIEESDWEGTLATYQQAGIVSPLSLLQIKETLLKQESSLHKLEAEARKIFIKILAVKGLLNQAPRTNYLSDKMELY
ncbi:MAG: TolC family protein, partial [Bacteroidota bacterium]